MPPLSSACALLVTPVSFVQHVWGGRRPSEGHRQAASGMQPGRGHSGPDLCPGSPVGPLLPTQG